MIVTSSAGNRQTKECTRQSIYTILELVCLGFLFSGSSFAKLRAQTLEAQTLEAKTRQPFHIVIGRARKLVARQPK